MSEEVKGLERVEAFGRECSRASGGTIMPKLELVAKQIEAEVKPYPPEGYWNQPGRKRWYKRAYGPRWKSDRWERISKGLRPRRTKRAVVCGHGWAGVDTSEKLLQRWATLAEARSARVVVGNKASYAPWVHGERQAKFHGARGWRTAKGAVRAVIEKGLVREQIEAIVREAARAGRK